MRDRIMRTAVAAASSLLCVAGFAATSQATPFSIDTTVPGGSAWIDGSVGSINGTVNVADQGISEGAAIGRILLYGQRSDMPANTLSGMPVFCIDVKDWLAGGVFVEQPLSDITSPGGAAQVTYTSTQLSNVLKFMVYAQGQGITDPLTSAAEQLGIWEILNESTTSWNLTSGNFTTSLWSDPDAVSLANSWLAATPGTQTTGYALGVLDPGRGNQLQAFLKSVPGDVPEPTTWAMSLMGFGLLGTILRRRRQEDALFA